MRRAIFVVLGLVAVIYMVGGIDGFRTAGARVHRWFAPSQQDIQRIATDTVAAAPPPEPPPLPQKLRNTPLTQPLSWPVELAVVGGIFAAALVTMYLTGPGVSSRA